MKNVESISPAQSRGARGLKGLTQRQLAEISGLGESTIIDFERERRQVSTDAIAAIRAALEGAGVEFIQENGGGPGIRLKKER